MITSWWRSPDELDDDQNEFINLPSTGRYLLEGPPGSGKTNLLLLRAQYIFGSYDPNLVIISFTKCLTKFIKSGRLTDFIDPSQIMTYHQWAYRHITETLGKRPIEKGAGFTSETRAEFLRLVLEANAKVASNTHIGTVFIDEVQDFSTEEISAILSLTQNCCICGDMNQGIYKKNGLSIVQALRLDRHTLQRHYRIGHKIAQVADRIIPPGSGSPSLFNTSNYNELKFGRADAKLEIHSSRNEQFQALDERLRVQLDAYMGDTIGILCGKRDTVAQLADLFDKSDLAPLIAVHRNDGDAQFTSDKRIHILTIHSAKGVEFRAVHIFGAEDLLAEELSHPQLSYTGVTRAKTALNVYASPKTNARLQNAFRDPEPMSLSSLFPEPRHG